MKVIGAMLILTAIAASNPAHILGQLWHVIQITLK